MSDSFVNSPEYYAQQSIITDPRKHVDLFANLPTDISSLVRIVQGLIIQYVVGEFYDVHFSTRQRREVYFRSVAQILNRIREMDPAPLTVSRDPKQRFVGHCRDTAVLLVSMLRHQGVPARVRSGYARYIPGPITQERWFAEYWEMDQNRWIVVDPSQDDILQERVKAEFKGYNPLDLSYFEHVYLGGHVWQLCRREQAKPTEFGINKRFKGWFYIRANLLHDLDALNKIEPAPWDFWGDLIRQDERDITSKDRALFDRLAKLTIDVDHNFNELRALYKEMPYSQIVRSRARMLGLEKTFTTASVGMLQPTASERLAVYRAQPSKPFSENRTTHETKHLRDETAVSTATDTPVALGDIIVRGARQHNLKNIDVTIPRFKLVVITGISGSGKSSLAFDTLHAEGQRHYVETLSSYARQFVEQMEKPNVDHIIGLNPTIAIEQKGVRKNPRSTVGTITEISDYLRILYTRIGIRHCPQCGRGIQPQTAHQIVEQLLALSTGIDFQLLAPIVWQRKGAHSKLLKRIRRHAPAWLRIDGEVVELTADWIAPALDAASAHTIEMMVDHFTVPDAEAPAEFRNRLTTAVETTLDMGKGLLIVAIEERDEILFCQHNICPHCDISFAKLSSGFFSFNSPTGMCPECNGLGIKLSIDPDLIVDKPHLSLLDGASPWYGNYRSKGQATKNWLGNLEALATHYEVDLELPWRELPQRFQDAIFYGSGDERIRFTHRADKNEAQWSGESRRVFKGLIYHINRLFRESKSAARRRYYTQFMSKQPCPTCLGERLCAEARFVTVNGLRLPEVTQMTIDQIHEWVVDLLAGLTAAQEEIVGEIAADLRDRLRFMLNVGLHYLRLDRPAPTLSGGEGQRIRLATQFGSGLVGLLYILDEPSIGLHPRDHHALLQSLRQLRDAGNTVLVVEHDEDTMQAADWLIDLGPGAGVSGGQLVAVGTPEMVMSHPNSVTGRYLRGELAVVSPRGPQQREPKGWFAIAGARLHNLKGIDVRFPVGTFTCVTGVSGSGKSSLVSQTLFPALSCALHNTKTLPGPHDRIEGLAQFDKVINITQAPIGRTPRSSPATYVQVMDNIRALFAQTPEAKARRYKAGRFSFNVKGGRCDECKGYGKKRIQMDFFPDVWATCKVCNGRRFNRQTLEITYKDKSIADVLEMDVQTAHAFFADQAAIARILETLVDVGLGYIKLGQNAMTLSGGEAQRIKLAKELSCTDTGNTLYILDEPTSGLHFADIQKLLDVLHRLTDVGNTIIVIEHNLDVIKTADWIIDLGPEGGDAGGHIVAQGPPEQVAAIEQSYTGQFLKGKIG